MWYPDRGWGHENKSTPAGFKTPPPHPINNKTVRDCIPPPPPAVLSTNRSVTKIRDDLPGHVEMLIFHVETTAAYCQTQGEEYY